jgi:hypothetical protein
MAARWLMGISGDSFSLAHQQTAEMADITAGRHLLNDINPSVRKAAGLDVHENELLSPEMKQKFARSPRYTTPSKPGSLKAESYKRKSAVSLDSLKPSEVRERTGFEDVRELLFFVTVVCGGDLNRMTEKTSYLTWLEEWFFYFEMTFGTALVGGATMRDHTI